MKASSAVLIAAAFMAACDTPSPVSTNAPTDTADPDGQVIVSSERWYTDMWIARIRRSENSATCCHSADLRDATSMLDRRLDYVWIKADAERRVGPAVMTVFGNELRERTASGLWPSDHGGLFGGAVLLPR